MGTMIFRPAARYPADPRAVFILALSVFSGITALALDVGPQSLEAVLPKWGVVVWGLVLVLGSLTTLIGMSIQNVNGIIIEQIGSVTVGAATLFYSGIALYFVGPSALQTIGIVLAWGLACLVRWVQLQVLIHSSIKRADKIRMLERIFAEIEAREGREAAERAMRRIR